MQQTYDYWAQIIDAVLEGAVTDDGFSLTPAEDNRLFILACEHGGLSEEEANAHIAARCKRAVRRNKARRLKGFFRLLYLAAFIPLPVFIVTAISLYTPVMLEPGEAATNVVLALLYAVQTLLLIPIFKRRKPTAHDLAVKIWQSRHALPHGARDAVKEMNALFAAEAEAAKRQESAKA